MAWSITKLSPEQRAIVKEIEGERDRGAAIIAAAFLEERLSRLLFANLVEDKDMIGQMFRGMGPASTFAAKNNLAYLMGIYPREIRDGVACLVSIRNLFAHKSEPLDFDSGEVRSWTDKIGSLQDISQWTLKYMEYFDPSDKMEGILDTSRNRFLTATKFILVVFDYLIFRSVARRASVGTLWSSLRKSPSRESQAH